MYQAGTVTPWASTHTPAGTTEDSRHHTLDDSHFGTTAPRSTGAHTHARAMACAQAPRYAQPSSFSTACNRVCSASICLYRRCVSVFWSEICTMSHVAGSTVNESRSAASGVGRRGGHPGAVLVAAGGVGPVRVGGPGYARDAVVACSRQLAVQTCAMCPPSGR